MDKPFTRTSPDVRSAGTFWFAALAGTTIAIAVIAVWWMINDRAREHIDSAAHDAARYVTDMPGFQVIEWADATLHVRWIAPLDGNEVAQDLDLTQNEPARIAVAASC